MKMSNANVYLGVMLAATALPLSLMVLIKASKGKE